MRNSVNSGMHVTRPRQYDLMVEFYLLLYSRILPESPRWLHAKGYVQEAEGILKMIAQQNGSDFPLENIKLKKPDNETTASKGSVIDLIRIKRLRWRTIIQIYLW